MKSTLPLLILCLIAMGCSYYQMNDLNPEEAGLTKICGVENPVENLEWLKDEIEQYYSGGSALTMEIIIYQAEYKGITVIIATICCPFCMVAPPAVRNCKGEILGYLGVDIDHDILDNANIIWQTNNGICSPFN